MNILIAYASKYGATKEIAEAIARVLEGQNFKPTVQNAEEVTSVRNYDAVIIGSALYFSDWLGEASELLESFQEELATKPVWLFSDGPTSEGDPGEVLGDWRYPVNLTSVIEEIKPIDIEVFGGKVDVDNLKLEDWLLNPAIRGNSGDYRDWTAIGNWAKGIARTLELLPQQQTQ